MVAELVDLYLKDSPKLIEDMRRQLSEKDWDGLRRSAHTLKGNSLQVGAVPLAEQCAQLEALAKAGTPEGAAVLVIHICAAFKSAEIELKSELEIG